MKSYSFVSIRSYLRFIICLLSLFTCVSCKEFLDIEAPRNQIVNETIFENSETAESTLLGVYSRMMSDDGFASGGLGSVTYLTGLSSDELVSYASSNDFFTNSLTSSDSYVKTYLWSEPFQYIYTVNSVLEGLDEFGKANNPEYDQIRGEAKFLRAFIYFYLVNLFGDVPLYTSTDYRINAVAHRSVKSEVYNLIIDDLLEAKDLLSQDYLASGGERSRPNKWAAASLLSRVYLYTGNWDGALTQSTEVINNSALYSLQSELDQVFLKNSGEAIWQLMPVVPNYNTSEGRYFILTSSPIDLAFVSLRESFIENFNPDDKRLLYWVGTITSDDQIFYYPFKYKMKGGEDEPLTEYSMVLRLAEQYLIRAEANLRLKDFVAALADVNVIRNRAGLPDVENDSDLGGEIYRQRRFEFFFEWGHRWLDLKRSEVADSVLGSLKNPNWQATDALYPIPQSERESNINISQNIGYN